jgi:hypothetical protein
LRMIIALGVVAIFVVIVGVILYAVLKDREA